MQVSFAALGEEFERPCVEPSVAFVVDPVDPGLPRCDLLARGLEKGFGPELGRCYDSRVKAFAQPVLLNQRRLQPLR